jgi:dipeptidyl aminopeptidase/acylaminoacyl peptidase
MMRSTLPSRRAGVAGVFAALTLLRCSREAPTAQVTAVPSETASIASASAPVASASTSVAPLDPELNPGARRRFVPSPEEPAPSASASTPAPEEPRKRIGTFQDWVKAYVGSGEPDTRPPPALGVLKDLPSLPSSTLVYGKSGHLIQVTLPSGQEKPLSSGAFRDAAPRWTKDGKYLYFRSTRDGAKDRIFRQRFPDGKAEAVTKALRTEAYNFDWTVSDDGARVAYVNGHEGIEAELTVVEVATGKEEVVHRGEFLEDLAFTRGGSALAMVSGGTMSQKIVEVDLATKKATTMPNGGYQTVHDPVELADGRLLFSASLSFGMMDRDPGFFTMPRGGGAWTRIGTLSAPIGYLSGAVAPDGKKIAARSSRRMGGFGADWHTDVRVLTLDGQAGKDLARAFPRPFYGLDDPSWAPDNRHLAAVLSLCPYIGCELSMHSVVLIDTSTPEPKLVFVGYGTQPAFRPTPAG